MLAAQSRYTACVGNHDLPGSTQELYRLVARMAGFASGSDENPFTREEASDAVRVRIIGSQSYSTTLLQSADAECFDC